jgi:2-C-methyl-D-erythritol 4-phosphate cytidylyltransferase
MKSSKDYRNIAVILAGGTGSRMGTAIPKQYVEVEGQPVIAYCLQTLLHHEEIDMAVIAVAEEWQGFVQKCVEKIKPNIPIFYSKPGVQRQGSIINALRVAKKSGVEDNDIVIIHDAARPLLTQELVSTCLNSCLDADAVLPVVPVKDTTYLSNDGVHIDSLIERKTLWNGQAPEAFRFGPYYKANLQLTEEELNRVTGSTEVAYKAGLKCVLIPGDPNNFKITTKEDLSHFETIVKNESI